MTYKILIATLILTLFNIAYSKTACGNNWCYSEDVTSTITEVIIQNGDDDAETTFEVSFTAKNQDCDIPSISFEYEKIDYDRWSETIKLYNNNDAEIATCGAVRGEQGLCPQITTCLTTYSLDIESIPQDTTYTIKVVESAAVDALCFGQTESGIHALSINAKLTLNCGVTPEVNTKLACGANHWCYFIDEPSDVIIQNGDDDSATTFDVFFTPKYEYCFRPSISFEYEKIDYNHWSETIKLYDNNNARITTCGATPGEQNQCPEFTTCLNEQSLGITSIYQDITYAIKVIESRAVDACCLGEDGRCRGDETSPHALSINAKLTLNCDTECDLNFLDTQCEYDADCPYCMQCCPKRNVCEFPRQGAESIVNALNEMDDKMDSVSDVFSYKYILLVGVILFVLINNVFIGYWCLRKKDVIQDQQYEKCDINVVVDDE